jgi:hypothetical protein
MKIKSREISENLWRHRWDVLQYTIDAAKDASILKTGVYYDVYCNLLDNLKGFAQQQYIFFTSHAKKNRPIPKGYTHDNALASTLNQVSLDLVALTQTFFQRHAAMAGGIENVQESLAFSDRLANAALNIGKSNALVSKKAAVLTYLQKWPGARVIPYSDIALIGVPFTTASYAKSPRVTRDLLAVPHEVGHYIHWNGAIQKNGSTQQSYYNLLVKRLKDKDTPAWARRWAEEVFADVYGCLVAGPMAALSFQDFVLQYSNDGLLRSDDGEHPLPILRPEVHTHMLGEHFGMSAWAESLSARWAWQRGKRKVKAGLADRFTHSDSRKVKLGEARDQLRILVDVSLGILLDAKRENSGESGGFTFDTKEIDEHFPEGAPKPPHDSTKDSMKPFSAQCDKLYTVWDTKAKNMASEIPTFDVPVINWEKAWGGWKETLVADERAVFDLDNRSVDNAKPRDIEEIELAREWFAVWRAGGWTTEGPVNEGPRP